MILVLRNNNQCNKFHFCRPIFRKLPDFIWKVA